MHAAILDPGPATINAARHALGLNELELEELLLAIGDRHETLADLEARGRLQRARVALELELSGLLAA